MTRRYGFAHRGGAAHGLDNRLETFRGAIERGATGLETDAWVTADGVVVLDHDGVLRTAQRRHEPMADVRRDELPAHVPTLDDLYDACGTDVDLAIDVKTADIAVAVAGVARRRGAGDRLWVVSPHSSLLEQVGGTRRAVTVKAPAMRGPRRRQWLREVQAVGIEAVNARWPWWSPALVQQVHDLGMLAFGYDAQRDASLRHALRIGLDGVFSDHVTRMVAALEAVV